MTITKQQSRKTGGKTMGQSFCLLTSTTFLVSFMAAPAVCSDALSATAAVPDPELLAVTADTASGYISAWGDVNTVLAAYIGYTNAFLQEYKDGNLSFAAQQGVFDGKTAGFWEEAEEIELVEDMYYWDQANNGGVNATLFRNVITRLANGFTNDLYGTDWSGDSFNDDICWASIAFARAGQITGRSTFTALAVSNLNRVWERARINNDALHYGLRQQQGKDDPQANVNFGFVTAAHLTGDSTLESHADEVYRWAAVPQYHLLQPDGKVRDSLTGSTDYSYNYGNALNAAVRQGDAASIRDISDYLRYHFVGDCYKYNGTTEYENKELKVLPNYAHDSCNGSTNRGGNDVGYDGIAFRGMGLAISRSYLNGTDSAVWAEGNVRLAYQHRDSGNLMWTDFKVATEARGNYSWNCSSALVGMLVTP